MAKSYPLQTNFTSGELDRQLRARSDVRHYYNGAAKIRNMLVKPQGGAERRPGQEYVKTIPNQVSRVTGQTITCPNGGTTANANDDDTTTEVTTTAGISTTNPFVVVHYDLGSAQTIKFADVVGLRVDGGSGVTDEFFIQYSTDNSVWTSVGNAIPIDTDDTNRRVTPEVSARYWRVARIGSTDLSTNDAVLDEFTLWTESATVSETRAMKFEFSTTQRYILVFSDRNVAVYRNGTFQVDVRTPYEDSELAEMTWTQSLDTLIAFHQDHPTQKLVRQGDHDEWQMETIVWDTTPQYAFTLTEQNPSATLTPDATSGFITLTAGSSVFVSGDVGNFVEGNFGRAKIIEYTSGTVVKAFVIFPFFDTSAIGSGDWTLEGGYEDAWSSTRGYLNCGTFHDAALYVGGANSLPQTLWRSKVGFFFDFDQGSNLDDEGFEYSLDTDAVNEVRQLRSARHLQIFASNAEFYVPQKQDEIITPDNITIRRTTEHGIEKGVPVQEVAGATLFVQASGKAIREFLFTDTEQSYSAQNIALLAAHLVRTPSDMALRKSTSTDDADILFLVNSDGTLATLLTLRDQEITAWALQTTDGSYKSVAVDGETPYFVVERSIDGTTYRFLEKWNTNMKTDAGVYAASSGSTITGLDHLDGEEVQIVIDNSVQPAQTVASGSITLARAADDEREAGLQFVVSDASLPSDETIPTGAETWLRDMPVALTPDQGALIRRRLKRVVSADCEVIDTRHMVINGEPIAFQQFGEAGTGPLDTAVPLFTGRKRAEALLGYDATAQVEVYQTVPAELTVVAIDKEVVF